MKQTTIISNAPDCYLELIHDASMPGKWIVRRSHTFLWFRKKFSEHLFTDRGRAFAFATRMMENDEALYGRTTIGKRPRPGKSA